MIIDTASPGRAIRAALAISIVFTLIGVSIWIVLPFMGAIVWATIIAISAYPAHVRLTAKLGGRRKLSAIVIGLVAAVVLFTPLILFFLTIGENAKGALDAVSDVKTFTIPPQPEWLAHVPLVGARLSRLWSQAQADVAGTIETIRPQLRDALLWLLSRIVASSVTILQAAIAIVAACVFLVTGPRLKQFFVRLFTRLGAPDSAGHLTLIERTVHGVSRGVVGTALIQALVLGLGYYFAGAPFPGLLAFLALILCSVQLGVILIGVPVAAWMWYQGDTGAAAFVLGWSIFVNAVDNFIKPILIGRDFPVPIWVGFVGVIGGLLSMGLIGLFIGPIILAVSYRLLVDWTHAETQAVAVRPPEQRS